MQSQPYVPLAAQARKQKPTAPHVGRACGRFRGWYGWESQAAVPRFLQSLPRFRGDVDGWAQAATGLLRSLRGSSSGSADQTAKQLHRASCQTRRRFRYRLAGRERGVFPKRVPVPQAVGRFLFTAGVPFRAARGKGPKARCPPGGSGDNFCMAAVFCGAGALPAALASVKDVAVYGKRAFSQEKFVQSNNMCNRTE